MKRVPNWDVALHFWAAEVVGKPYVWGSTDCGSLVRSALVAMYGQDVTGIEYATKAEALRVHAETGGVEAVLRGIGATDVDIRFAQQGDILIEPDGDGMPCASVVVKRDVIAAIPEAGVVRARLRGRSGTLLRVPYGW